MEQMQSFMKGAGGRLRLIAVTSRDAIHYDSASSTDYATLVRRSDLHKWRDALGGAVDVVTYRLDTPRDCRDVATQVLDGYGPFALAEDGEDDGDTDTDELPSGAKPKRRLPFEEMGRPLTVQEWDFNVAQDVLSGKQVPPDDRDGHGSEIGTNPSDVMYTPEAIRERELGRRLLAVYTPGHTYGSVSYVFPEIGVCCSGFTIPVEASRSGFDDDGDEPIGTGAATGPILDCRGYVTTSRAGIARQMESARKLVEQYGDRFEVVLPSRGDPLLWLPASAKERKRLLLDLVQQFEKIGRVYEELGITSSSSSDDGTRF
jgi:glyoxylase-like metal-dependent hydrolase (beta-lactamase superfamily II)